MFCRKALQLKPEFVDAYPLFSDILRKLGRIAEAESACRNALAIRPDCVPVLINLSIMLADQGRLAEAEAACHRVLAIQPDNLQAFSNLLFFGNYHSSDAPERWVEKAHEFGHRVRQSVTSPFVEWRCANPATRLRVGLVSGDIRDHSVGHFLEGLIARIDPTSIELIAYPTSSEVTELTMRVMPFFTAWTPLVGFSDEAAARRIHDDGVHILLDLAGVTSHNRLPVFAWKPAPVQISWLGYCATTGLPEIDYYLADAWTLPPEQERFFTEKIWRLPKTYLCFSRPSADVLVSPLPATESGYVTFGSFNNLTKVTTQVIALWARILQTVPDSRLFIKALQLKDEAVRSRLEAEFADLGIPAERLLLEGPIESRGGHLAAYQHVDIALDPFPYNGVTTTVEALWMGVPVLTLAGDRFLSRQGVGILNNAGLPEWVASDEDDLVAKAVTHASDLKGLALLRTELRERIERSPLMDAQSFATDFSTALWAIWRQHSVAIPTGNIAEIGRAHV